LATAVKRPRGKSGRQGKLNAHQAAGEDDLYSTIDGAGRVFRRKEVKRWFARAQMDDWIRNRGVTVMGADLDECPMA
jgi:RNA-splicing ligase RtcB